LFNSANANSGIAGYNGYPGLGYYTIHALEYGGAGGSGCRFYGDNGVVYVKQGLQLTVDC
jgi:hypothetical protein